MAGLHEKLVPWYKQKTSRLAIAGMLTAAGGYFAGDIGLTALIGSLFVGLGGIFFRQGVEKSRNPTTMPLAERGEEVTESSGWLLVDINTRIRTRNILF